MNLIAYGDDGKALFERHAKNKADAKIIILNHGMLSLVDYVTFKHKQYPIREVYTKW